MIKTMLFIVAVALLLFPVIGYCEAGGWTGNLSVFFGKKYLDENDWKPFENPPAVGFLLDFRPNNWPVNIAVDYLDAGEYKYQDSSGSIIRIESQTQELNIGVRKIFEFAKTLRPYVGGGLAYIRGEFKNISSDDDSGTGFWINTGLYWAFVKHFNIGIDLRYSSADITLFGKEVDAGGFFVGLTGGFRW